MVVFDVETSGQGLNGRQRAGEDRTAFVDPHPARHAGLAFSDHADWQPVLARIGLPPDAARRFAVQAKVNGTDFQSELLASGEVREEDFFRALAQEFGLPFVGEIDPEKLIAREADCLALLRKRGGHKLVKVEDAAGVSYLIAPERIRIGHMRALLTRYPGVRARLKITTTGALRRAALARARPRLARIAARGLFEEYPEYSARIVANAWQGAAWGAAIVAFLGAITLMPETVFGVLHCILSLFFLSCIGLRFAALQSAQPPGETGVEPAAAHDMPVYSMLVALYDEAEWFPACSKRWTASSGPRASSR